MHTHDLGQTKGDRSGRAGGPTLTASTSAAIQHLHGGGQPLSGELRDHFEPRFGHDFSQVRVHTSAHAGALARDVGAPAFTIGTNIVFAQGQYPPDRQVVRDLLRAGALAGGVPLDSAMRSRMETAFGQGFEHVRVHDDASAHASAQALGARAYSVGQHVVYGAGQAEAGGPALLAHELAHTVQQAGVQLSSEGPHRVASDPVLEAEADAAARSVVRGMRVPPLSRIGMPVIQRATNTPAETSKGPLPSGMTEVHEPGTEGLVVQMETFVLPSVKGKGAWVKEAYEEAGNAGRLVFSPLITPGSPDISENIQAFKEGDSVKHQGIWLRKYGFDSIPNLAKAITDSKDKEVEKVRTTANLLIKKMVENGTLQGAGCDIDHIVEKQLGGTSIPNNLQLLSSEKNQKAGAMTWQKLRGYVAAIRAPKSRGPLVTKIQLRFNKAVIQVDRSSDPGYEVENLLRRNKLATQTPSSTSDAQPASLIAMGMTATAHLLDAEPTKIPTSAAHLIPGMRLSQYVRGTGGPKRKVDKVEARLKHNALKGESTDSKIMLDATLQPGSGEAGGERRLLSLPSGHPKIKFFYPYLSPGELTTFSLGEKGLEGSGVILPSVPILNKLAIKYTPDELALVAPLDVDKLKSPHSAFRFTKGELALKLSPEFLPISTLEFEIGPKGKPVVLGKLEAKAKDGAFVAQADLALGTKVPGIDAASGVLEYHSAKGWSGALKASSTALPSSTTSVELGFASDAKGKLAPYGHGGIQTKIRKSELSLAVAWRGDAITYKGGGTIVEPIPQVPSIRLDGSYADDTLTVSGKTKFVWQQIESDLALTYRRKDGQEGCFSGATTVKVATKKASGEIKLIFGDDGTYTGKGSLTYAVTKSIRPTLGVELAKDGRVKLTGEVALADLELGKRWPSERGGERSLIKGLGVKFSVPTPILGVTAFGEVSGSLGIRYGVGPVTLKGVEFKGSLYPFEDNPHINARLRGKLVVPGYGELYGTFGAKIGAEVLLGAAGAKGGIEISPALRISGEAGLAVDSVYDQGGFAFEAEAFAEGAMHAKLGINLSASVYALSGMLEKTWVYQVASLEKQLGPTLKISFGKVGYSRTGEVQWPSLSQIRLEPESIDSLEIVKDAMGDAKDERNVKGG